MEIYLLNDCSCGIGLRPRRWAVVEICAPLACARAKALQVDTAAGNLYASRVRSSQWRSDCNCSAAEAPNRGDNGRLHVRPTVNRDCPHLS